MRQIKVNLACGDVFVDADDWINFDYSATAPGVRRANLLAALPLERDAASLVYVSHFLEHIPRSEATAFLRECARILAPGGTLRLVVPDLENMCRAYLAQRDQGQHGRADFVVLEMLDQCVRREPGGELGRLYRALGAQAGQASDLVDFVRERTGENLLAAGPATTPAPDARRTRGMARLRGRAETLWIRALLALLPAAFRAQNVSMAAVGERHHWVWDFHQLRAALEAAGFVAVVRHEANSSGFAGFPFRPLDISADGRPRKGLESMYVEAQKPGR